MRRGVTETFRWSIECLSIARFVVEIGIIETTITRSNNNRVNMAKCHKWIKQNNEFPYGIKSTRCPENSYTHTHTHTHTYTYKHIMCLFVCVRPCEKPAAYELGSDSGVYNADLHKHLLAMS